MTSIMDLTYTSFVERLAKPGDEISASITPARAHLLHMVVGISGEAGELLDAVKKHVIYNKPLDRKNVVEELGDLEFYMQGIRNGLGLSRAYIIEQNMKKLGARYKAGYSDAAAQARADKADEAALMSEVDPQDPQVRLMACSKCAVVTNRNPTGVCPSCAAAA